MRPNVELRARPSGAKRRVDVGPRTSCWTGPPLHTLLVINHRISLSSAGDCPCRDRLS